MGTNDDELTREIEEAENAPGEDYGGEAPEQDEEQPTPPARQ